ncbi:MAG: hypothetical protein A2007_02495 [Verrucomicrobia bacterium GWC2_42_7]|nr:MAG: hypothetical protein A2007_02495 [Verrucomicrobia bacterium GWC2_42_7]
MLSLSLNRKDDCFDDVFSWTALAIAEEKGNLGISLYAYLKAFSLCINTMSPQYIPAIRDGMNRIQASNYEKFSSYLSLLPKEYVISNKGLKLPKRNRLTFNKKKIQDAMIWYLLCDEPLKLDEFQKEIALERQRCSDKKKEEKAHRIKKMVEEIKEMIGEIEEKSPPSNPIDIQSLESSFELESSFYVDDEPLQTTIAFNSQSLDCQPTVSFLDSIYSSSSSTTTPVSKSLYRNALMQQAEVKEKKLREKSYGDTKRQQEDKKTEGKEIPHEALEATHYYLNKKAFFVFQKFFTSNESATPEMHSYRNDITVKKKEIQQLLKALSGYYGPAKGSHEKATLLPLKESCPTSPTLAAAAIQPSSREKNRHLSTPFRQKKHSS